MDNLIYTEKKIFKHKPLILSLTPSTGERRKKLHNKKLKMGVIVPLYHLNLNPRRNFTTIHSHQNVAEIPYSPPSSCSSSDSKLKPVNSVKASHAQIIKMMKERDSDIKVHSLVTSYLKSGDFHSAAKVFLVGFEKNYLYWIAFWEDFRDFGGDPYEILEVFVEFHNMGVTFENETLAMILKLCAELRVSWLGMEVHACLIKRGFELNQYSKSALLNFFGSCLGLDSDLATYNSMISEYSMKGQYDEALHMIGQLKHSSLTPTVVTWTALISGSCQNGYYENAFNYCYQMQAEGVKPNSASVASLLRACSGLSIVFQKAKNKTLASWNSMIMGFSTYGHGKEAISLFQEMQEEKLDPDAITMTALLSGCKHSGLMDEGWKFFDKMEREYGITPTIQHYSCMVDLLGRAGYLDEAWDFIRQMPMEPDSTVWGAFLGSCRTHGNIELGEVAAKELFKLEPQNPANYILLMNMYASSQRWDDVDNIKDLMDHRSVKLGNVWSRY